MLKRVGAALAVLLAVGILVPALEAGAAFDLGPDHQYPSALPSALWAGQAASPQATSGAGARRAMGIIDAAQRHGVLRAVLGPRAPRVVALGALQDHGRAVGVTALLALPAARHDVHATVPGARFTAPVLRDLLVDVDLRRGAIVGVQPGPDSRTTRWSGQTTAAAPAATVAARPPAFARLSPHGPAFATYDGVPGLGAAGRDWPISLVFAGHATVGTVKSALRSVGFTHVGERRWLAYRTPGGALRFDGDRGLKTGCDANGADLHVRLYAPPSTDHFTDPRLGSVVVASVHLDRGESCSTPPRVFGFSEVAERRVADLAATALHWRVRRDRLPLGNAEPYRRDLAAGDHVWWNDGRATLITVP
ncbi:MAG: hypothetical protein QOF26_3081 [Baekduia sp.]|nr:hypothetical protein [Baekduia sp.]